MNVLGIDTSTSYAGVGLSVDGEVASATWWSRHNHGREVMPAVMRLMEASGIKAVDLDAVAVALGPGGFSAVRVGIATGQGLVAPTNVPLIGVPTHLIQCYPHRDEVGKRIVSLIPVGRHQVSFSVYGAPLTSSDNEIESGICEIEEIDARFGEANTILCGEGATAVDGNEPQMAADTVRAPENLLSIAVERLERGHNVAEVVEPVYSRPPTITAPKRT